MEPPSKWVKQLFIAVLTGMAVGVFGQAPASETNANQIFKAAFAYYQSGDYTWAVKQYSLAISMDPNRNYFYYNRGMAYRAMGNTPAALADFKTSNRLKPTAEAYYQAGMIHYDKGEFDKALPELENAKMMRDDLDRMNFCLGMLYFKKDRFDEALACFAAYTTTVRNFSDAYYYRGLTEAKLGKYSEALTSFKLALRQKENDWQLYYKMYEFYLALGDKQNALNSITMVIETGEKKVEHYEKRAELYKDMGMDFKVEEDMAAIQKLKTTSSAGEDN